MLHEPDPLQKSRKVSFFTDAEKAQREEFVDRQAEEALRRGITLIDRLDSIEQEPQKPQENAGSLGIDWSIT